MAVAQTISASSESTGAGRRLLWTVFETAAPYTVVVSLLVAWQVTAHLEVVSTFLLPPPLAVIRWLINDITSGKLLIDISLTLYRTFAGFALAAVIGISVGILMAQILTVRWFFDPILSFGLPLPKVALLPIFMLWFGLYDLSKILMVAFSACFQIAVSTWQATRGIEKELIWSARAFGASEREIWWQIILRAASPQIITGLQIALPVCMIVVLVTEMQMGGRGLGDSMLAAARYAKTAGVFAGIVEIGVVGFAMIKGFELLRRRLLVWHQEAAREQITV